jgi:carbon starvation protein
LAIITLVPLVWLLAATMTAGVEKIWHPDPRIGFLAQARALNEKWPALEQAATAAGAAGEPGAIEAAESALRANRVLHFNNLLDAALAGVFLVLVAAIALLSAREWILLLARRKLAVLRESQPVWLPHYAVAEAKPLRVAGLVALAFALARELSGEAQMEREHAAVASCGCGQVGGRAPETACDGISKRATSERLYLEMTERRFKGVRRCC